MRRHYFEIVVRNDGLDVAVFFLIVIKLLNRKKFVKV
jgi:hypothetical protein